MNLTIPLGLSGLIQPGDGLVVDEICLAALSPNQIKKLFDLQKARRLRCRHMNGSIPRGCPRISRARGDCHCHCFRGRSQAALGPRCLGSGVLAGSPMISAGVYACRMFFYARAVRVGAFRRPFGPCGPAKRPRTKDILYKAQGPRTPTDLLHQQSFRKVLPCDARFSGPDRSLSAPVVPSGVEGLSEVSSTGPGSASAARNRERAKCHDGAGVCAGV